MTRPLKTLFYTLVIFAMCLTASNLEAQLVISGDLDQGGLATQNGLDNASFLLTLDFADPPSVQGGFAIVADSATLTITGSTIDGTFTNETGTSPFINANTGTLQGTNGATTGNINFVDSNGDGVDISINALSNFSTPLGPLFSSVSGVTFDPNDPTTFTLNSDVENLFLGASTFFTFDASNVAVVSSVPEPNSLAILGIAGLAAFTRRRRR